MVIPVSLQSIDMMVQMNTTNIIITCFHIDLPVSGKSRLETKIITNKNEWVTIKLIKKPFE